MKGKARLGIFARSDHDIRRDAAPFQDPATRYRLRKADCVKTLLSCEPFYHPADVGGLLRLLRRQLVDPRVIVGVYRADCLAPAAQRYEFDKQARRYKAGDNLGPQSRFLEGSNQCHNIRRINAQARRALPSPFFNQAYAAAVRSRGRRASSVKSSHAMGLPELGIFGATRFGDPLASRSDGDGVFTKVRFTADARVPLAKRLGLFLSAGGQIADRPLLASEELGLGGAYRTRGYDFAEVLGDEGVYALAEMRYTADTGDLPLDFLQFYAFADGGYVSDIAQTGGEGSLFSAGPGVRARLGVLDLELESAFPLGGSGERQSSDDPEFNIRSGLNF